MSQQAVISEQQFSHCDYRTLRTELEVGGQWGVSGGVKLLSARPAAPGLGVVCRSSSTLVSRHVSVLLLG